MVSLSPKVAPIAILVAVWVIALSARHGAVAPEVGDYVGEKAAHYRNKVSDYFQRRRGWKEPDFKAAWLAADVDLNTTRISQYCAKSTWREDIVLELYMARGGLGNIRAEILDFIHLAVIVGAPIILPQYSMRRSKSSGADALGFPDEDIGWHDFGHIFDTEWFVSTMREHCPQMTIYRTLANNPSNTTIENIFSPVRARTDCNADETEAAAVQALNDWIPQQPGYVPGSPVRIRVKANLLIYNMHLRPKLRTALGRLLRIAPTIRELAAETSFALHERYGDLVQVDPREQLHRGGYCGVHMRTEEDAVRVGWTGYFSFKSQTNEFIELCGRKGFRVMYVASGRQEDIDRLATKAWETAGMTVISKSDLLDTQRHRDLLKEMSFDQLGALDYEVLARSSFFIGPEMSSFSWNLAIRRHFNNPETCDGSAACVYPYAIQEDEPLVVFDDSISRIILKPNGIGYLQAFAPGGMFP
ncbi:alternative oxidase [Colletotrichum truncatum]|uniref:Alternative oxidase n=1 Tax=Colletotrichum truncatum TaxID=5467 RepID=A0ACC3ZG91_COLTU|nr:alternative oxidase [Colletotrichum truncatum]KAF6784625.1 alternative oxidase [Colletotrichum truncatum]